jgi:F-type H+-transporting ATPase subunit b
MLFLATLLLLAAPRVSYAVSEPASDAHHDAVAHHESAHHAASLSDLLFPAINFSIYLFIVVRYVVPAMQEYLRRRRSDVLQAESESRAALSHAEQGVAASRARLASLKAEADGIRQDLLAIATRQAERLTAQADETGRRRLADAALVAEQERRRALADVRADVADAAVTIAERKIRGALTADDQRSFVQQFLKDATTR